MVLSSFCVRKGHLPLVLCRGRRVDIVGCGGARVCIFLSVSGFTQCCSCVLPGPAPWLPVPGGGETLVVSSANSQPPQTGRPFNHFNVAIVLSVDVSRAVL